jgi:hypothetical protein
MEHDELTDDEKGLIATAIFYGPFPPKPEYLPECHRLYERGWFDIGLTDEHVVFSLIQTGVTALELGLALDDAKGAVNWCPSGSVSSAGMRASPWERMLGAISTDALRGVAVATSEAPTRM